MEELKGRIVVGYEDIGEPVIVVIRDRDSHPPAEVLRNAIEHDLHIARTMCELIEKAEDFELLASGLSIFCFRYAPPGFTGDLDRLNQQILVNLQRGGSSYVSNAMVNGNFALRGCVLNYRTTERDMEQILDDVRRAAQSA